MTEVIHFLSDKKIGGQDIYVKNISHDELIVKPGYKNKFNINLLSLNGSILFFPFKVIYNFFIILLNIKNTKGYLFHVHGSVNLAPVLFCLVTNNVCIWHKHESSKKFCFIIDFLSNIKFKNLYFFSVIKENGFHYFPPVISNDVVKCPMKCVKKYLVDDFNDLNVLVIGNINNIKNYSNIKNIFTSDCFDILNFHFFGSVFPNQVNYYNEIVSNLDSVGAKYTFHGWCDPLFIYENINRYDLMLCCSISEGTPTYLLEGMYLNIPIISSDVGNISYALRNYENKYIYNDKIDTSIINSLIISSYVRDNNCVDEYLIFFQKNRLSRFYESIS